MRNGKPNIKPYIGTAASPIKVRPLILFRNFI